ncbi:TadE/TadG family type IV pilus assembly protein [Silicimonas sp. MF1-12-2]|uniref:TadE/TadG family type IV pilus assembly protein n=1 Tax=Silicimonas sp. MF1-12-2 TaxID=3384793 RepID=UPI0039B6B2D7
MTLLVNKLKTYKDDQNGNATIEFVVLFPAFVFLFLTGFEAGYYMVRSMALERAVDVAIRDVRLGNSSGQVPGYAALKRRICEEVSVIPDCMQSVQVELQPVPNSPGAVASVAGDTIRCVDRNAPPNTNQQGAYDAGSANQMMLVRVCALSEPLFPTTGIGVGMRVDGQGNYAIVTTTAFVNEPGARVIGSGSSGGIGAGSGSSTASESAI